ncbi:DUF1292 domain-containing protein [Geosporobacter ferrireducens]|uniref:UPF0473 protein Gferi_26870 n=1 Tax=Geosporobacter ferrireducens TaxID=1424294 RepID=A0A1D8GPH2_9FIRM|nr:DUF1292 domain-containing protein [Geosporobacter ferrireducens]AOT72860.1 hypothetical protein Gferi_26870 [Geosporobacter ferrireducens]MTI55264.1 DUF1292 domain-containing protein [Geosporobacter ferrireducens]
MENDNIVTLLDEEGKETDFEVIATLEVNENEYAILLPLDGDSEEAFIFKMIEENGGYSLECVESDEEFNAVAAAYEDLLQEEEYDEEE